MVYPDLFMGVYDRDELEPADQRAETAVPPMTTVIDVSASHPPEEVEHATDVHARRVAAIKAMRDDAMMLHDEWKKILSDIDITTPAQIAAMDEGKAVFALRTMLLQRRRMLTHDGGKIDGKQRQWEVLLPADSEVDQTPIPFEG